MAKNRRGRHALNQSRLRESATSFIVPIISDPLFSEEKMVFFVYNHAETKPRPGRFLWDDSHGEKIVGKPAGFGLPGGGINPEHLENAECAARREGEHESTLVIKGLHEIPFGDIKKNKVIIENKKGGKMRFEWYADGRQRSVQISSGEEAFHNPIRFYRPNLDWENSPVRKFLVRLRDELIDGKIRTAEEISRYGLGTNSLTESKLLAIGVDKEEVSEIGGFALLPVNYLKSMWEARNFVLDPEEDPDFHVNNRAERTTYVYFYHVKRVLQALYILKVIGENMAGQED